MAIAMYNSLKPGGFNLTRGGQGVAGDNPNKRRNVDGSVLPAGVWLLEKRGHVCGYVAHDGRDRRTRSFVAKRLSMPEKLRMAKAWLAAKLADEPLPEFAVNRKWSERSDGLPEFVAYVEKKRKSGIRKGYKVWQNRHGKRAEKSFFSKPTLEENLADAKAYLTEMLKSQGE